MEFTELLGNEQLKQRLAEMLRQQKTSHCYLISGPEGSGKHTLATLLAAALQCAGSGEKPCRRCPQCRKVFAGIHPDVIFVDDEARKTLPVEQIRRACADVFVQPNEGAHTVYVFPHAEKLTPIGQNTLLKVLEEPPAYAVFLLLAPNPGLLLPTVRSRCAALQLAPLPRNVLLDALRRRCPGRTEADYHSASECGWLGQALTHLAAPALPPETEAFLTAYAAHSPLRLLEVLTPLEKRKREQLLPLLQTWEGLLTEALAARCAAMPAPEALRAVRERRTAPELLSAVEALREAQIFCTANVSPAAVCGALAVKL